VQQLPTHACLLLGPAWLIYSENSSGCCTPPMVKPGVAQQVSEISAHYKWLFSCIQTEMKR